MPRVRPRLSRKLDQIGDPIPTSYPATAITITDVGNYYTSGNVEGALQEVGASLATKLNKAGDTMSGTLNMGTHSITNVVDPSSAQDAATKGYVDGAVTGLLDFRGVYNASGNVFPSSGGSGTAGAILKGDTWIISVAGVLGGVAVEVGDMITAIIDTPGSTAANWNILDMNRGFVPENVVNKDIDGTMAADSDIKYPSQKATNTRINAAIATVPNETTTSIGALINGATAKTTPIDADFLGLMDSAASNVLKKLSWANVKATLKTYFDTLYQTPIVKRGVAKTSGGTSQMGLPGTNFSGVTTALLVINRVAYIPFKADYAQTLVNWQFEVTIGPLSAANLEIYIYAADADLQPSGNPLYDSGNIAVGLGATGLFTLGSLSVPLAPGNYLLAYNCDVAMTLRAVQGTTPFVVPAQVATTSQLMRGMHITRTYGSTPNPGTKWDTADTNAGPLLIPIIWGWTE